MDAGRQHPEPLAAARAERERASETNDRSDTRTPAGKPTARGDRARGGAQTRTERGARKRDERSERARGRGSGRAADNGEGGNAGRI